MRVFISLALSLGLSTLVLWVLTFPFPEILRYKVPIGNFLFIVISAIMIYRIGDEPFKSSRAIILSPLLFMLLMMVCGALSLLTLGWSPELSLALSAPLDVIGYDPSGPDTYLPFSLLVWLGSVLVVMAIAVALGTVMRKLRTQFRGDDT